MEDEIARLVRERSAWSDAELLDELSRLPPLADEDDPQWDDDSYWATVANPYLAFVRLAERRRLRAAIRPLLDRACFGDPYEGMRGLRHSFEKIVAPDWRDLADICMDAARSDRRGTVLWATNQLMILEDERARFLLVRLSRSGDELIREAACGALRRLDHPLAKGP